MVGSGIVGSACAYAASSLGARVTLIDAGWPGQATAAGAGIVCPWTSGADDPAGYAFACSAARAYPALVAELADLGEADVSYRQAGAVVVADREDELEPVRAGLEAQRAGHPEMGDVQVLPGPAVQRLFPPLRPAMPAVYIPGAARVDGRKFRDALVRAACRKGVTIRAGDAALVCRADRASGVLTGGELIEADAVVAATGAWTPSFAERAGAVVRVTPQRGQIVHLSLGSADTRHWPVVPPVASGHYLLAFEGSRPRVRQLPYSGTSAWSLDDRAAGVPGRRALTVSRG